jgi:hypothetical protein
LPNAFFDGCKDLDALKSTLSRSVLKDAVLDWPVSFARRRGFNPERIIGRFIDTITGIKQVIRDKWLFVVNYEAFKAKKSYNHSLPSKSKRRESAKKGALFVDLKNALGAQARMMRQDLKSHEKIYEQVLLRNSLSFEIKQQYPLFERTLEINRVKGDTLDKFSDDHECAIRTKAYLEQYQRGKCAHCYRNAADIDSDLPKHFTAINYFSQQKGLIVKDVIKQIKSYALVYKHPNQIKTSNPEPSVGHCSDELERLKSLKSPEVDNVLLAKEKLDKASKPLPINMYTRRYKEAIITLCRQEKQFLRVKNIAPKLAADFEKVVQPPKEVKVGWLSSEYNT